MKRLFFVLLLVVCVARADSSGSIYNLHVSLTDASGTQHGLDMHRGHPVGKLSAAQSSLMGQAGPKLQEALVKIPNGQRKLGGTD